MVERLIEPRAMWIYSLGFDITHSSPIFNKLLDLLLWTLVSFYFLLVPFAVTTNQFFLNLYPYWKKGKQWLILNLMWTSPCDSIGEIAGTFSGCKFISSVRGALEMLLVCVSHGISKGHETNVSLCFLPQGVYLLNVALHQQSVHLHNSCCAAIFLNLQRIFLKKNSSTSALWACVAHSSKAK